MRVGGALGRCLGDLCDSDLDSLEAKKKKVEGGPENEVGLVLGLEQKPYIKVLALLSLVLENGVSKVCRNQTKNVGSGAGDRT